MYEYLEIYEMMIVEKQSYQLKVHMCRLVRFNSFILTF